MPRRTSTLACICLATACASAALAQSSGGDFAVTRQVVAGGGDAANGSTLAAVATAGQVSVDAAAGGAFAVRGGFHVPGDIVDPLFADGFEGATP